MSPEEILRQSAERNRLVSELKEIIRQEIDSSQEWFVVTLEGYSPERGAWKVRKFDGSILYAEMRQKPHSIGNGDTLIAYQPRTGHSPKLFLPL